MARDRLSVLPLENDRLQGCEAASWQKHAVGIRHSKEGEERAYHLLFAVVIAGD